MGGIVHTMSKANDDSPQAIERLGTYANSCQKNCRLRLRRHVVGHLCSKTLIISSTLCESFLLQRWAWFQVEVRLAPSLLSRSLLLCRSVVVQQAFRFVRRRVYAHESKIIVGLHSSLCGSDAPLRLFRSFRYPSIMLECLTNYEHTTFALDLFLAHNELAFLFHAP
jgi:hypothetical protein